MWSFILAHFPEREGKSRNVDLFTTMNESRISVKSKQQLPRNQRKQQTDYPIYQIQVSSAQSSWVLKNKIDDEARFCISLFFVDTT